MDELRGRELGQVEPPEQRELLETHRAGRPRLCLADGEVSVVERHDRLDRRSPGGQVGAGQQAALRRDEAVDLLRDEALVEDDTRLLDLLLARAAAALVDDAPVGRTQRGVAEERARLRRGEVELARAGPPAEELLVELDGRSDPLVQRIAVLRVPDRELEDVRQTPGAEVAEEEEPAAERAWNAGCEDARPRDQLVPEVVEALDRRGRRCDTLAAEREGLAAIDGPEERGDLATRPVQVRLHDLENEARRARRVEGVPAPLEHGHPGLGREPVRRRDHPEGAAELRAGGKRQGRTTK